MNKVTDPTPAPPLEGRGVPHGVPAAGKAVNSPEGTIELGTN